MKRSGPNHPKLYNLCYALNCSRPTAIGYLELLWHFTAQFAPTGNIGVFSDHRIETACDWRGRNGRLIRALLMVGFLDGEAEKEAWASGSHRGARDFGSRLHNLGLSGTTEASPISANSGPVSANSGPVCARTLVVHDWSDHCDDATRKRLARSNQHFATILTGQCIEKRLDADRTLSGHRLDNGSLPEPEPEPSHSRRLPRESGQTSGDQRANGSNGGSGGGGGGEKRTLPQTAAFMRGMFPDIDERFMLRFRRTCRQAAANTHHDPDIVTDELLLQIVRECTKKNQESAGLYLTTVPAIIATLGEKKP